MRRWPTVRGLRLAASALLVAGNERIDEQLALTGIADVIGPENMLQGTERLGATSWRAYEDATAWVEARRA